MPANAGFTISSDATVAPTPEPPASYWRRRDEIAALAAGVDAPAATIDYTDVENEVWSTVTTTLRPLWDRHAASGVLAARDQLALPTDRVPQLAEVDARLRPLTGFGYRAVAGTVPAVEFFEALANRTFASTQYVRWEGDPLYTPEPDVIHEVVGHGNCLACPEIAELHRLAGEAIGRVHGERARQFIADVFWFSVEFGVVREHGELKAYGTGLLSSPSELTWFGGPRRDPPPRSRRDGHHAVRHPPLPTRAVRRRRAPPRPRRGRRIPRERHRRFDRRPARPLLTRPRRSRSNAVREAADPTENVNGDDLGRIWVGRRRIRRAGQRRFSVGFGPEGGRYPTEIAGVHNLGRIRFGKWANPTENARNAGGRKVASATR